MLKSMLRDIRGEKRLLAIVVLLILVNTAATIAPAEAGQRLIRFLEQGQYGRILPVAVFLLVAVLVKVGSDFLRQFFAGYMGQKIGTGLQRRIHDKFLRLPPSYFKKRESGELLSRTTNDIQEVRFFLSAHLPDFIKNPLIIVVGLVALFLKNWLFTLEILGVGLLIIAATHLVGNRIRRASGAVRESLGRVTARLQQSLFSVDVIKLFNRERYHREQFDRSLEEHLGHCKKEIVLANAIRPINELLSSIAAIAVVGTGIYMISGDRMKANELVGFILYLAVLSAPLNALSFVTVQYRKASASYARIGEILAAREENARKQCPDLPSVAGEVRFDRVFFRYRKGEPVLEDISFRAKAGSMTAIVGPSGSGKTTLVSLLPRLIEPARGRILIDGSDTSRVNLASLRRQIGMVTQESILFTGTVMENIRYGRLEASDEEVVAAARAANADGFIRGFRRGYDTLIGERGLLLSGGQRQRIALARVLLRDPAILILDEATSALDSESEKAVQEALLRAARSRTTFVVAHRLSTVRHADRILVLDQGGIVQQGTHDSLLSRKGLYRRLHEIQFLK